jgi:alpha-beta hydrolase superfamily lysophospholipase
MPAPHLAQPQLPDVLTASDGTALHVHHWPVPQARGVVQMAHGLLEHLARYDELARQLNAAGWAVAGIDHRGHGRSQGPRGSVPHGEDFLRDQALLHDQLSQAYRRLPHIMLGSSMGGVLAARIAAAWSPPAEQAAWARPLDGIILIAPALEPTLSVPQRAAMAVLSRTVPDLALPVAHRPDWVTTDPEVVRDILDDPLMQWQLTPRVVQFMSGAAKQVMARCAGWCVPTLLLYAEQDKLVSPQACQRFANALPPALLTAHSHGDMAHDLIHEPGRARVFETITTWLEARL